MSDVLVKDRPREANSPDGQGSKPWDVDVDVYLYSCSPLDFCIDSYLQSNSGNEDLYFYNRNHPGFNVRFHLHDETGQNYRFPDPPRRGDALWSKIGTDCPTVATYDIFSQHSISVTDQGATVVAYNPNSEPAQFQYTLNVSTTGGPPYCAIDPGGNNMNGNSSK
jgi:hypothetical protein